MAVPTTPSHALLIAGVPQLNRTVFHRIRMNPADPVAWIQLPTGKTVIIVRDVELPRARQTGRGDSVHAYEDFKPATGFSSDRAIRAAQSVAECMVRNNVKQVAGDRSLSLIFVDELRARGIEVICDRELGVRERRQKDPDEIAALRAVQELTERAIRDACETIANADVDEDGRLVDPDSGQLLTSERVKRQISRFLSEIGASSDDPMVAGGPEASDCHFGGSGPLRTGEPIIIDVFPRQVVSGYYGDCTRTVVHGEISETVAKMHAAVAEAKKAAIDIIKAGTTGDTAHHAAVNVLHKHGYSTGFESNGQPGGFMPHGTGHGIGLDLKEPPLLDIDGPELLVGDAVTVEPALYDTTIGGVRLEDMVIVTEEGCMNLNQLPEELTWK